MDYRPLITMIITSLLTAAGTPAAVLNPIQHNWEASLDTDGNSTWEDIGSNAAATGESTDTLLDFAMTGITRVSTTGQGVTFTHAYDFSGPSAQMTVNSSFAHGSNGGMGANTDSTFEMWLRLDSLPANNRGFVLFESGGGAAGISLTLRTDGSGNSSIVASTVRSGTSSLSYAMDAINDVGAWLQLAFVLDITGGTQFAPLGTSTLYLNNATTKAQFSDSIDTLQNWGGINASALGYYNSTVADFNTANAVRFDGQVSIFRFYEDTALSASQVRGNFEAHLVPEPSTALMTIFGTLSLLLFRRYARRPS